jgi:hypothetical protein
MPRNVLRSHHWSESLLESMPRQSERHERLVCPPRRQPLSGGFGFACVQDASAPSVFSTLNGGSDGSGTPVTASQGTRKRRRIRFRWDRRKYPQVAGPWVKVHGSVLTIATVPRPIYDPAGRKRSDPPCTKRLAGICGQTPPLAPRANGPRSSFASPPQPHPSGASADRLRRGRRPNGRTPSKSRGQLEGSRLIGTQE